MLTVFGMPKPFRDFTGVIQRNAIASWTRIRPTPEIILFGNEEGTAEVAREFGLRHVPNVRCNEFGTPLLDDLFSKAQYLATSDLLCYINADIFVFGDFMHAVEQVTQWRTQFLIVGQRRNVNLDAPEIYLSREQEMRLQDLVLKQNQMSSLGAMDYFIFPRGLFTSVPQFAIGRGLWDNWLLWKALSSRVPVVDASDVIFVVHQNHPQSPQTIYGGEEGRRNRELAGGRLCTMEHATHRLAPHGIVSNVRQRLLRNTRRFRHALGLRRDNVERFISKLGLVRN